jgi:hypothetical protein
MQTHWRLAFMFDATGGDMAELERALAGSAEVIRGAAAGNSVRIGVAMHDPAVDERKGPHDVANWRHVDGAIEVSIPNGGESTIPQICKAMRPVLKAIVARESLEVMVGPMHHMVPLREGGAFLSLAFRRYPGTTVDDFREWWYSQHAPLCIPILGEEMLGYDQVHVDPDMTRNAAEALGVPFVDYDAYDNLTYRSQEGFLISCSDEAGMALIAQDEEGRIDNTSRRHALMRTIA